MLPQSKIVFLLFILLCTSCAQTDKKFSPIGENFHLDKNKRHSIEKFNQLEKIGNDFLILNKKKIINIYPTYLHNIYKKFKENNKEIFKKDQFKIVFYDDKRSFHFSLPGLIVISKGLMNRHINTEDIFKCIIGYELLKSEKGIYRDVELFPSGYNKLNVLFSINKLRLSLKENLNKWTYEVLKNTNKSYDSYLTWLQIQNRNYNDFNLMIKNPSYISIEESRFKSFLIARKEKEVKNIEASSKVFFKMLNKLKRL